MSDNSPIKPLDLGMIGKGRAVHKGELLPQCCEPVAAQNETQPLGKENLSVSNYSYNSNDYC